MRLLEEIGGYILGKRLEGIQKEQTFMKIMLIVIEECKVGGFSKQRRLNS